MEMLHTRLGAHRCLGSVLAWAQEPPTESMPVAVISDLSGTAWVTPTDGERRRLETFDWLTEGSMIADSASSALVDRDDGHHKRLLEL